YWRHARDGTRPASLSAVRAMLPSAHAETLASRFRLGGPRHTVVTACSSGAVALAEAAELIADGVVEVAVAGGVDAITRICFMGFNALKLLDPAPCRPFDRERRGMSIGEGAGFMVLESEARARARGARVYATLAGHGMTTDAFHVTAPEPEGDGMVRAMSAALARAGAAPREVQYANAHGTGTPQNDRIEARALARGRGAGRRGAGGPGRSGRGASALARLPVHDRGGAARAARVRRRSRRRPGPRRRHRARRPGLHARVRRRFPRARSGRPVRAAV